MASRRQDQHALLSRSVGHDGHEPSATEVEDECQTPGIVSTPERFKLRYQGFGRRRREKFTEPV